MSLWEQRVTQARQLWINGDHAAAERELRTVLADGDFDSAVHANCLLGALLDERDDAAGARAMYQRAIDSGHPIYAQLAAISLGPLLFDADDLTAAQAVLRFAADGALKLGNLRAELGDVGAAVEAFRRAESVGGRIEGTHATANIAVLLAKQGEAARRAFERLIASGVPGVQATAALELGNMLRDTGDEGAARTAYERALEFDEPAVTPYVYQHMGAETAEQRGFRLMRQGDTEGARAAIGEHYGSARVTAFWCAAWTGPAAAAPILGGASGDDLQVCSELGLVFGRAMEDDASEAREFFRMVADHGHPALVPKAHIALGELAERQRENALALAWYRRASSADEPETNALAGVLLAQLLSRLNDREGAKSACRHAISAGSGVAAVDAGLLLGQLHHVAGDVVEAQVIWDRAEESAESPEQFGVALHHRIGQIGETADESLELLRRSTKSTDPSTAIIGMGLLGERADDPAEAIHWFGQAAELGVPGHSDAARGRVPSFRKSAGIPREPRQHQPRARKRQRARSRPRHPGWAQFREKLRPPRVTAHRCAS
ncbi:tetratricopeptide repeat protein [Saccharopolyspora hattusasensis]|uniref:tetratricopeptide repeat protein n=1 Tax=Saccharopolyspora hattusasensis TaxID=1128679 RepID=UPI003D954E1D